MDSRTKKSNAKDGKEKSTLKWLLIVAVVVVVIIAAVATVVVTDNMKTKANLEVVKSDMDKYVERVSKLSGGEVSMELRTYGDASEALKAFVEEYNKANSEDRTYVLSYNNGDSVARGKTDPWGNKYYVTAKKTSTMSNSSTYTYIIISAGKNGEFNTSTLVLDDDDTYANLLTGVAVTIDPSQQQGGNKQDPDFGVGEIVDNKDPEPSDDPSNPDDPQTSAEPEGQHLPIRVTITFNNQGGSGGPTTERIKNGTLMSSLSFNIPQKENYVFMGYYTEGEGKGYCYFDKNGVANKDEAAAFTDDVTLYAYWVGADITITFDNDGGSGKASVTATYGEKLPKASVPKKTGYSFLGYYTKPNGEGERYYNSNATSTLACEFTKTTTLYAYWSAQSYTVEHYVMSTDGTYPASPAYSDLMENSGHNEITLANLADPSLIVENGIVYDKATVDGVQATVTVIENNNTVVRLYYKRCQYDVSVTGDNTTVTLTGSGKYYYGAKVILTAKAKDGYTWIGWMDVATDEYVSTDARYTFTMPTGPVAIEGYASNQTYTTYFDANGGYCTTYTIDVAYGELYYNKLPVAEREGHTFLGWAISSKDKNVLTRSVKFTDKTDITLYAVWEKNTYTITFNHQGGQGGTRELTVTYGGDLPSLNYLPTRDGYTLIGYFTSPYSSSSNNKYYDSKGNAVTTFNLNTDITLYARWSGHDYLIEYYDKDGEDFSGVFSRNAPTEGTFGEMITLLTPTKEGYSFGGWYTTSDCYNSYTYYAYQNDPEDTVLELYALWIPLEYQIIYRDEGNKYFTGTHGKNVPYSISINSTATNSRAGTATRNALSRSPPSRPRLLKPERPTPYMQSGKLWIMPLSTATKEIRTLPEPMVRTTPLALPLTPL